jgi:hypothetical protein
MACKVSVNLSETGMRNEDDQRLAEGSNQALTQCERALV